MYHVFFFFIVFFFYIFYFCFFFFNDTATTEIYTLSLHDALPIWDITGRKKAEEALRESEQKLKSIIDNTTNVIYMKDVHGKFLLINKQYEKLFHVTNEEIIGKTDYDIFPEDKADAFRKNDRYVLKDLSVLQIEELVPQEDGIHTYLSIKFPLLDSGKPFAVCGISTDITERKRVENIIRTQRDLGVALGSVTGFDERLRLCIEAMLNVSKMDCGGVYLVDKTSGALDLVFHKGLPPDFVRSALHYDSDSDSARLVMAGKPIYTQHQQLGVPLNESRKSEGLCAIAILPIRHRNQVIGCFNVASHTLEEVPDFARDALETITAQIGNAVARLLAEKTLRESEARLNEAQRVGHVGSWELDIKTHELWWSDETYHMFGFEKGEFGNTMEAFFKTIHPDDQPLMQKVTEAAWYDKKPFDVDHRIILPSGEIRTVHEQAEVTYDDADQPVRMVGTVQDISERKKTEEERINLEEQLIQSQKMESMGRLAEAVAHELNQVLTGLVTYPDILLLDMEKDDPLREKIENIKKSGQTAAAIVEDLLSIARGGVADTEALNINNIIIDYTDSPEIKQIKKYNPDVIFNTELDPFLLNIISSEVQILKILHNLTNNAVEAMLNDGRVLISTVNKNIEKPVKGYEYVPKGEYVLLCVSDTGIGIPEVDIKKIFEPYYTKKVLGRTGSGIGLTVVWNIVKEHNGFIDVISEVGNGTVFHIYFPVTEDKIVKNDKIFRMEEYIGNGETVLIIDDEENQREIVINLLKKLNYSPAAVSSGEEAIEYLKINKVDLLMLDMLLGEGMDGLDTYKKIRKICHNQKVIIISGFSASDNIKEAQKLGAGEFVKKHITVEEIGMVIKKELDKQ